MPLIRDALGGSSSYGTVWPHPGAVTEVSAQEAADLLRIDPRRYTEVIAEPEPDPVVAAAEDAEARQVTEPAPAAEFSESPKPRGGKRGKPGVEE
jgi:hypothetical protein